MKIIRTFNYEYLDQLIKRDNAELIGDYSKLNGGIKINFKCSCTKEYEKLFRDISYYGGAFCKECCKKNKKEKIKNTCKTMYGVENPSQLQEIKNKKEETYLKNFGMHPRKTEEVKEKCRNTCIKKYNTDNPAKAQIIKNKIKNTFNKNYGGHPMKDNKIKEKVKNTCFKKYGGYPAESNDVKNKMINTFMEKYGCFPTQTSKVMEKLIHSSKSYKKYIMPSGKIRNIQGYEKFALDILLKEYNEEQIKTDRSDIPRIKYINNNKIKYYFPDIYIPDKNLIIEVKSSWTYKLNEDINKIKENETKHQGYNFEFWIFDRKGNRIFKN